MRSPRLVAQARETLRNEPRHDRLLAHAVVLAILGWLPVETVADAALVAALLAMPEADAAWLLDELEEGGCVARATRPVQ